MRLFFLAVLLISCRDKDTTGGTDTGSVGEQADADGDGFDASEDCDDSDGATHPGAPEVCDGIDNDCDGEADEDAGDRVAYYADDDGDGYGDVDDSTEACEAPPGHVEDSSDCDDTDPDSHPGAAERCDEADNDCDGSVDEEVRYTWYADADGDGFGDADSAHETCDPPPGYIEDATDCDDTDGSSYPGGAEVCDEADNDCDGDIDEDVTTTWYQDIDSDGFGVSEETTEACARPTGYAEVAGDCDDDSVVISPNAAEVCDGVDNDCDSEVDEDAAVDASTWYADGDGDGYGDAGVSTEACEAPTGFVDSSDDCDDTSAAASPGELEVCDEADNDCDGEVDEDSAVDADTWYADGDGDGYGSTVSTESCEAPSGFVDSSDDCDDGEAASNPGESEVCDELDNDCDGSVDEDVTSTWYLDADEDGYGDADRSTTGCTQPADYVADDTDCDDLDAESSPDGVEVCDGADNDCDGEADEDAADLETFYADDDGDGYGDADDSTEACEAPTGYTGDATDCDDSDDSVYPGGEEVCDEVDNDCDGDIDAEDDSVVELCAEGESCLAILVADSSAADGYYAIDPTGDGAFEAYCNMTDSGGGWTLVASISASNDSHLDSGAVAVDSDGLVDDDEQGEKLDDAVIDALWTDRVWVEIYSGSGDIHCELSSQPVGYDTWSTTGSYTCGYTYSSTASQSYAEGGSGPTVWKNYDYRAYDNPYSGCSGAAATYVGSGAGGCGNHPSRGGALWVR